MFADAVFAVDPEEVVDVVEVVEVVEDMQEGDVFSSVPLRFLHSIIL